MGLVSARRPGWLLEAARERRPRGMVAHRVRARTEPGLQALWHVSNVSSDDIGKVIPER